MEEQAKTTSTDQKKDKDEIALELMKFIAGTTGYAKGAQSVGFSGKGQRTPEEQADALLALYDRCRKVVNREE